MLKRLFDISLSLIGLFLLSPVFVVVAIWIKVDSQGPVFFRQSRVGRFGVVFEIHKFRTMSMGTESHGRLTVGRDVRITRAGAFLRKSKIDELPQLIDVLLGDMSLVGPRPEVQEFINYYPDDIREIVLSVRPGITDRASIEMIDENEILAKYDNPTQAYIDVVLPMKQQYYCEYVNNNSVLSDLEIIFATVAKIVLRGK